MSAAVSHIGAVRLDERTVARGDAEQRHERDTAIFDLIEDNRFAPINSALGPFVLEVALLDTKLGFVFFDSEGRRLFEVTVSLTPLRALLKDYAAICESYCSAIRHATPAQIEIVDRERTSVHNRGAFLLIERFRDCAALDEGTGRRLFTLVAAILRR